MTSRVDSAAHAGDETELLRARAYTLIARLLARPPDGGFLAGLAGLRGDGTPFGAALEALGTVAARTTPDAAAREYHDLFIGVTRGEVVPYASFHISGFLFDRPLARLRADMRDLGIVRAPGVPEPEDHIASLFDMMAGLITGDLGGGGTGSAGEALQRTLFERHLAPWADRFFKELARAPSARLYRPVGDLGQAFIEIETEAFALTPA